MAPLNEVWVLADGNLKDNPSGNQQDAYNGAVCTI